MKKVLVILSLTNEQKARLEDGLEQKAEFLYRSASDLTPEDMKDIDGIIGNVRPDLAASAPNLSFFQLNSAGADPYAALAKKEGLSLHSAVGAYGRTVSEHMTALTFALVRRLPQYMRDQQKHLWSDRGAVTSVEDATVLVLGLGDIGGSYARRMKALGAYVIGVRKSSRPKPDYIDEQVLLSDLDKVIGRADIVASVLPHTEETAGLFNADRMGRMKKGAYLINCGRGGAVVLDDLMAALDAGQLAGAGLDVTDPEPLPAEHPLWDYEQVLLTPHVAGGFHLQQTYDRILEIAGQNLRTWLQG